MNKKYVVLIITAVLLISLVTVAMILFTNKNKTISYQGSAYFDGELITKENVTIHLRKNHSSYATLPFLELLKKLGFSVEWQDDLTAKIGYEDKYYILSLADNSNPSLTHIDDDLNLLVPAPGGRRYVEVIEKDIILDDGTIHMAVHSMSNIYLRREIDRENKSIKFEVLRQKE